MASRERWTGDCGSIGDWRGETRENIWTGSEEEGGEKEVESVKEVVRDGGREVEGKRGEERGKGSGNNEPRE